MTLGTLVGAAAMARALRLPPALTRGVTARRGISVRARDGVILRTDHYAPDLSDAPTVLIRTPYGRGFLNGVMARTFAERGYHVVLQSCRGTGGSAGSFAPMRHEREDGQDTVDWLRRQPWFSGRFATFGPSYLGFVQWAIADTPELAAMATIVTASQFREPTYAGAAFSLHTTLTWAALIQAQDGPWLPNAVELLRGQPRLKQGLSHLPLAEADVVATGRQVEFFREWLEQVDATDGYWATRGHQHRVPSVKVPVLMIGGWHDIFLPWQLRDYAALRATGAHPQLTIGPWTHGSYGLYGAALRESLAWFDRHLRGDGPPLRDQPVRVHVGGAGRWEDFDDWPPRASRTRSWWLQPGRGLAPMMPRMSVRDRFTYDPADPTPSIGGPLLIANVAGPRDNQALEARTDVLVYSSRVLREPVEVVGPVTATVYVRASNPHFDIFVRLCDVASSGVSTNVCDGLIRVSPEDGAEDPHGTHRVEVELWPAAHRFQAGHRLRLQISGGAHPRYARNPGTGQSLSTAVELRATTIDVCSGPEHPSALHLPVLVASEGGPADSG